MGARVDVSHAKLTRMQKEKPDESAKGILSQSAGVIENQIKNILAQPNLAPETIQLLQMTIEANRSGKIPEIPRAGCPQCGRPDLRVLTWRELGIKQKTLGCWDCDWVTFPDGVNAVNWIEKMNNFQAAKRAAIQLHST